MELRIEARHGGTEDVALRKRREEDKERQKASGALRQNGARPRQLTTSA